MTKKILVLGAGAGGIVTANELSRLVGNDGDINPIKIILFEREEKNLLPPLLLWLMAGKRKASQVYRKTKKLEGNGIEVVIGEIEKMNPYEVSVTVDGKEYQGDYMVVSLGLESTPYHKLDAFGYNFYSIEGAEALHERLKRFNGGKVAVVVPSIPIKGPTAPYQAVMLMEDLLREKGLHHSTEISLYSPEYEPLSLAGTGLSGTVKKMLTERGIHYYPKHSLVSATANELSFSNGQSYEYDLMAYTPKCACPEVVVKSALKDPAGCIKVDPHTMETSYRNVFAIGDVTDIYLDLGDALPKTGAFAQRQAKIVAHNIAQRLYHSKDPIMSYNGEGQLYIETGGGKAGTAEGNFYSFPFPDVKVKKPDLIGRWSKVWWEKYWWFRYF